MRLIKRFYFPDGRFAEPQTLKSGYAKLDDNTYSAINSFYIQQWPGFFSDELEVEEIKKLGVHAFNNPEHVTKINQLVDAINAINRELAELKEKSK